MHAAACLNGVHALNSIFGFVMEHFRRAWRQSSHKWHLKLKKQVSSKRC